MKAYRLRYVPLAISVPTLLIVLLLKYYFQLPLEGATWYSVLITVASLLFLHTMRDWKKQSEIARKSAEKNNNRFFLEKTEYGWSRQMEIIREIAVFEGKADPGTIRIFGNGSSYLIFEWFPLDDCSIDEETLTVDMAAVIGVRVYRADRERFIIASNDAAVIDKAIAFLRAERAKGKTEDAPIDKMRFLKAYMNDDESGDYFYDRLSDAGLLLWVDWRDDDGDIAKACERLLRTGDLSAEVIYPNPSEASAAEIDITYKGERRKTVYAGKTADRDTTIVALNEALQPDYEIRFCLDSNGNDTLAFLPLSASQWAELESEFGAENVGKRFSKISKGIKLFG
jgi:hypothetical protein